LRKCIVASGVLVEDGRVLLIRHERLGVWLYPGGHVEPNETPREAAEREFKEETGLEVKVVGPTHSLGSGDVWDEPMPLAILLETVRYPDEVHLHYDLIFLVRRVGGSLRSGRWFTAEEIENLETYENVKNVLRLALKVAGSP
jgi:8-oxo-dGTP pyrophosphatase MutT (NUDIX family)